jgi:hypothetical protein
MRLSRDEAGGSETGRGMLNRLFPTRVTINAPGRNPELAEWKKMLEEDICHLKLRNNRALLKLAAAKRRVVLNVDLIGVDLLQHQILSSVSSEYVLSLAVGHSARSGGGKVEGLVLCC